MILCVILTSKPNEMRHSKGQLRHWYNQIMSHTDSSGNHINRQTGAIVWPSVVANRILRKADHHLDIDVERFIGSMNWLATRFMNTSYIETEESELVILRLTKCPHVTQKAFVLLTFIESADDVENFVYFIQMIKDYIEAEMNFCEDMIAFVMANHVLYRLSDTTDEKFEILNRLRSKSKHENGMIWWEVPNDGQDDYVLRVINTEITSYALLTLLMGGRGDDRSEIIAIAKWLGLQIIQNPSLGYIEAMISVADYVPYIRTLFSSIDRKDHQKNDKFSSGHIRLTPSELVGNEFTFKEGIDPVLGMARYKSNEKLDVEDSVRNNQINVTVVWNNSNIELCVTSISEKDTSLMVVEIYLPSAFVVLYWEFEELRKLLGDGMVEMIDQSHMLKVHVKFMKKICHKIKLTERFNVESPRNKLPIIYYDYFNPRKLNSLVSGNS